LELSEWKDLTLTVLQGCGQISSWFVGDLVLERANATTEHIVQAIGSSSISKGQNFAAKYCPKATPSVYDSYQGVFDDTNVDIVYIGTPHVFHCQNALDAIAAGKHVLCEKPIAMTSKDAQKMMDAAKAKGVFLMEAVWTRFFPIVGKLQSLLHDEKVIGNLAYVQADFSMVMPIDGGNLESRTSSKQLGAGALLDIGIYALTWASIVLDSSPGRDTKVKPKITASMLFHDDTSEEGMIDEQDTIILQYSELKAQAVCTASLLRKTTGEFCIISGSKGSISVGGMAASRPGYLVVRVDGQDEQRTDFDIPGFGFHWEADAVAADIRAGKLQNETMPFVATLTTMGRMDAVRQQCGLVYPQDV
jgi:predicted dehydrogenase